jgi:chemotaxis protein CheD
MSNIVDVNTGEVKLGNKNDILTCRALGSCIAVVIIDPLHNAGGVAHVMLPNSAPDNTSLLPTKYAQNAIHSLVEQIMAQTNSKNLISCIAGGGNVLKREDDTICTSNIYSVSNYLTDFNIPIINRSIGGFKRRSLTFNLKERMVRYTIGNSKQKTLLHF